MSAGPVYPTRPVTTRGRIIEIDRMMEECHQIGADVVWREFWAPPLDCNDEMVAAAQAANLRAYRREVR